MCDETSIKNKVRSMGLDVGEKRIGVALSDELGMTAQPYEVIVLDPRTSPFDRILDIVSENDVASVIIGLPVNMNGTEGNQARDVRKFRKGLKRRLKDVEIHFQDERLSSSASERMLLEADMRRDNRRQNRDKIAAALILQVWLDSQRNKEDQ